MDMTKRQNLAPCPFCGGEAVSSSYTNDGGHAGQVKCEGCGVRTHGWQPYEEAVSTWNRRVRCIRL